jgi:nucleoside-diphosphate-sugar epimerase
MTTPPKDALVLVTGASGYIAGHCVRDLLENGYRVRGTVRSLADPRKVEHLQRLATRPGALEFVEADLTSDRGWREAVAGCTYVQHVASPFPAEVPKNEMDLIGPAVEGTKRVLQACAASGTVKRVVMTSSVAAIAFGHTDGQGTVRTESDWSKVENCEAYQKSKTLAERAAWDFVKNLPAAQRFELAVINPGFVLGPLLNSDAGTSGELIRKLMVREMPACPEIGFAPVDVRDVALAHRLAMERPEAPGNRYICAGEHLWVQDMAKILAAEFNPRGYRIPTGHLPYWLMWIIARFDKAVRLALEYVGRKELVSSAKAQRELGWRMRPIRETIIDTAQTMIEHGVVPAR